MIHSELACRWYAALGKFLMQTNILDYIFNSKSYEKVILYYSIVIDRI